MSPAAPTLDDLLRQWNAPFTADPFDEHAWDGRKQLTRDLAAAILAAPLGDENGRTRVGGLQIATAGWTQARGDYANSVASSVTDPQKWIAALGTHEHATLTADGQGANRASWCWCAGGPAEWVRYEYWTAEGREGHGFVCAECRRLVQTG